MDTLKDNTKSKEPKYKIVKPDTIDQEDLFELIKNFDSNTKEMNKYKKISEDVKKDLKSIATLSYLSLYKEGGENPGSIIIEAENVDGNIAEYMFSPSDRYITIKSEKEANEINSEFGDIVTKDITYTLNNEMIDKYGEILSKLIFESDEIEKEDKGKFFIATETYKVKEGTIDNLLEISDDPDYLYESIKPVSSIKGSKIVKS